MLIAIRGSQLRRKSFASCNGKYFSGYFNPFERLKDILPYSDNLTWGVTRRVLNSVLQYAMSFCLHSASTFGERFRLRPLSVDAGDYSCRLTCFIG